MSVAVGILLAATSTRAADVAGNWVGHVPAVQGQGESDITFTFKVNADNVTGTLNNSQAPGDIEIKEGKVSGDEISFC